MRRLTSEWVDCFAVVMLSLSTVVSFLNQAYGTAVIAALCAGLVAGMAFAKWSYGRKR